MKDEEVDEEYIAELERAYRRISWGCMLFILGVAGAAIVLLILAHYFSTAFDGLFDGINGR